MRRRAWAGSTGWSSDGARAGPPHAWQPGSTDLDRVEVTEGLAEGDQVALLPSSGLTESQDQMKEFMRRRGGIPGITQRSDGTTAPAPSR